MRSRGRSRARLASRGAVHCADQLLRVDLLRLGALRVPLRHDSVGFDLQRLLAHGPRQCDFPEARQVSVGQGHESETLNKPNQPVMFEKRNPTQVKTTLDVQKEPPYNPLDGQKETTQQP